MTQKRNRDRVMAEITPFHLMRLANERGCDLSREQAMAFLNQERAQEMWKQMMQAGLDFIACSLLGDAQSGRMYKVLANANAIANARTARELLWDW